MKKYLIIISIFLINRVPAQVDTNSFKLISSATSPFGNYIYLCNEQQFYGTDSNLIPSTDYFIVERTLYTPDADKSITPKVNKIGIVKCIQNIKDLKNYYSDEYIENFKKVFKLSSTKDVINYFNNHYQPRDYFLYYQFIETKMALGHVFLDKDVKEGEKYMYIITRVGKDKSQKQWGLSIVDSKIGNYLLPNLKPSISNVYQYDSAVILKWKLPINDSLVKSIAITKSNFTFDTKNINKTMPFEITQLRANLYELDVNGKYNMVKKLLGQVNETNDTITYTYQKDCLPEQAYTMFIRTEDEVYNEGLESDTTIAFSINENNLVKLTAIEAKEIENGIKLSWKQLQQKPYLYGIELGKFNSEEMYDSLGIISPMDTTFIDTKLEAGQHYRYQVRAMYLPQLKMKQDQPASAVATITKFSKPYAPYNLKAIQDGKNIKLTWESKDQLGLKGYYIYRGTSTKNLNVVEGPIVAKTYTDTAQHLSGRSAYFYTVLSENLMQDTSIYSNIVKITPNRKIETSLPNDISFYYSNGILNVSWTDTRINDNAIEGFMVQKRKDGDKDFVNLNTEIIANNKTIDSNLIEGVKYHYRIANVTQNKVVGDFGDAQTFELEKKLVDVVNVFYVRNIENAIEISLPQMQFSDRKSYTIYRRDAGNLQFEKLTEMDANTFKFIDKTARSKQIYVYAITITSTDGREGVRGKSISLRKD
jgi:hypothetical protein